MRKCNNARFNKHDCANDGTCGQSIQNYEIGNTDISFFDDSRNLIAKVPKLPKYSGEKYGNRLYREAESKQFYYSPTNIYDVLPSSFTVKHGYINCTEFYFIKSLALWFRRNADEYSKIPGISQPLTHSGMTVIGVTLVINI